MILIHQPFIIRNIATNNNENHDNKKGVANSLASGILIYVSMVEMLAEELGHPVVKNNYPLKFFMIKALSFGFAMMCALAIWA